MTSRGPRLRNTSALALPAVVYSGRWGRGSADGSCIGCTTKADLSERGLCRDCERTVESSSRAAIRGAAFRARLAELVARDAGEETP